MANGIKITGKNHAFVAKHGHADNQTKISKINLDLGVK